MKQRTCSIALAVTTILVTSQALADQRIAGAGARTCGQFAEAYKDDPTGMETMFFSWAQGYMSAANDANASRDMPTRDLSSKTPADMEHQIRDYCDAHPLSLYHTAVLGLYVSLPTTPAKQ